MSRRCGPTRRRLIAVSLLTLLVLASPAVAQVSEQVRVQFVRAEVLFRSGDSEGARLLLDRVIEALDTVDQRTEADDLLLRRALLYRARIAWNEGDRDAVDDDLDRLLALDPTLDLGTEGVAPELAERLEVRKERRVGYLQVALYPQDAEIWIDGRRVADPSQLVPLSAGVHRVEARRAGYASAAQEVDIRANRTEGIGFELQRTGATISIATHPAGATVRIDGQTVGTTQPGGPEGVSETLRIVGLLPGTHEIEVTLADHRTFRQQIDIPTLADFDLGTLDLDRSLGALMLRDLPAESTLRIDGQEVDPERQVAADGTPLSSGSARLTLPVGEHTIEVASAGGVFETRVNVSDGETVSVDVNPRPGIVYLGVMGGETLDRETVGEVVPELLADLAEWFPLVRPGGLAGLGRLPEGADDIRAWRRLQRDVAGQEAGAALLMFATLPEASRADAYTIWVQAAAPGPVRPLALRVPMGDPEPLDRLEAWLATPLPPAKPWLGASLIDTELASGVRVVDVEASGPAAQAGLRRGDLLLALDGDPLARAADVLEAVAASEPFQALTFEIDRAGERSAVPLRLGSSPWVPAGAGPQAPDPILWAAATAALASPESALPAWALEFHRALALLRSGEAEEAAERLAAIQLTGDPPFGQAAIDYWQGLALLAQEHPDDEAAAAAFDRASSRPGARLEHNDGPHVAPRAMVRRARLEAGEGEG